MLSICSFKLTKVPDHLMCNLKRSGAFKEKLNSAFNGNPMSIFAMFLLKSWECLSDFLVTHSVQRSNQITDKIFQTLLKIRLYALT